MKITTETLENNITRIVLDGRLDIEGAATIDLKMNVLAGSAANLLLDLEQVGFLGSMGLRFLHSGAVRRGQNLLLGLFYAGKWCFFMSRR